MSINKILTEHIAEGGSSFTTENFYNIFLANGIPIATATDILISFIEESSDDNLRFKSLEILGEITHKNLFAFFENILISDQNALIRGKAAELLIKFYPNDCHNAIKWIIEHDSSSIMLRTLIKVLKDHRINSLLRLNEDIKNKLYNLYGICPDEVIFLLDLEKEIYFCNLEYFRMYSSNSLLGVLSPKNYYMMCTIDRGHIIALNLSNWGLKRIPESICYLLKLKYLILRDNTIKFLPESIGKLQNLEVLDLQNCDIQKIPNSLLRLKRLNYLSFNQNKNLKKIPRSLILIAKQYFSKKYIMEGVLAEEAFVLGLLEILSGVKLEKIEMECIIYKENANFYKLNKYGNIIGIYLFNYKYSYLNIIPIEICKLKFLIELELPNNNITNIPSSIGHLSSLRALNLRNNLLTKVPNSIKDLDLTSLKLAGNKITNPPEWIKKKINREERVSDLNGFKRYFFGIPIIEITKKPMIDRNSG